MTWDEFKAAAEAAGLRGGNFIDTATVVISISPHTGVRNAYCAAHLKTPEEQELTDWVEGICGQQVDVVAGVDPKAKIV